MSTSNASLKSWVEEVARLTKPDSIHWCTGSDAENSTLIEAMLRERRSYQAQPDHPPELLSAPLESVATSRASST